MLSLSDKLMRYFMKSFIKRMVIPTIIMIWATVFFLEVIQYPPKNYILIRPVYYVMLIFYVVNGALDFFSCRKRQLKEEKTVEGIFFKQKIIDFCKSDGIKIPLVFISLFITTLLFDLLGFFIVIPVFMVTVILISGVRDWKILVIFPVILTVLSYLIFKVGLDVALPFGILS